MSSYLTFTLLIENDPISIRANDIVEITEGPAGAEPEETILTFETQDSSGIAVAEDHVIVAGGRAAILEMIRTAHSNPDIFVSLKSLDPECGETWIVVKDRIYDATLMDTGEVAILTDPGRERRVGHSLEDLRNILGREDWVILTLCWPDYVSTPQDLENALLNGTDTSQIIYADTFRPALLNIHSIQHVSRDPDTKDIFINYDGIRCKVRAADLPVLKNMGFTIATEDTAPEPARETGSAPLFLFPDGPA